MINKCDLLGAAKRTTLRQTLRREFPRAEILETSARKDTGLDAWLDRITAAEQGGSGAMAIEYDLYAEGRGAARLVELHGPTLSRRRLQRRCRVETAGWRHSETVAGRRAEIARLKMTLSPDRHLGDIAVINLVRNDYVPEVSLNLEEPVESGRLIIDLRAEATPEALRDSVRAAITRLTDRDTGLKPGMEHLDYLRPGKPTPTHGMTTPA